VRKLTFGKENGFEKFLCYSVAAFEVNGYRPREEDVYVNYSTPGKQVGRLSLRGDRTLFLFVFADERGDLIDSDDTQSQKKALHMQFGDLSWECPQILAAMESCPELYFDRVSQIRMDTWSRGTRWTYRRRGLLSLIARGPRFRACHDRRLCRRRRTQPET
jgi:hypothetical protein